MLIIVGIALVTYVPILFWVGLLAILVGLILIVIGILTLANRITSCPRGS